MRFAKHAIIAAATTSALALLAACGDANDAEPADDVVMDEEAPLTDPLTPTGDELAGTAAPVDDMNRWTYTLGETEIEVAAMQPSAKFRALRERELAAAETERRDATDAETVAREVETAAREWRTSAEPLRDPIVDPQGSFGQLDRDDDDQLSVAEFAIYDLANINPAMKGAKQDEARPFVSTEAINMVSDDFVRLDADGNNFLSMSEFEGTVS